LAIVELPAPVRSCAPWASFNSIPTLALQKKSGRYVLEDNYPAQIGCVATIGKLFSFPAVKQRRSISP